MKMRILNEIAGPQDERITAAGAIVRTSDRGLLWTAKACSKSHMNTLLNIKAFLLVARTGSFSGAARELGVAPSVVTKRITRLEDEMGAQLFIRSTRALSLTSAGERLLPQYQRLVAELDEIIGAAAAAER